MLALPQAVVAMESLRAIMSLVGDLKPHLHGALAAVGGGSSVAGGAALEALFSEVLTHVPAMCTQIYRGVSRNLLLLEPVVGAIKNKSWTSKDATAQHGTYVDQLLQLIQQLQGSLTSLANIPMSVHVVVLEEAVAHIGEQLVDSYAAIKKCSDEGRISMTRDVKVLQAALDNLLRRGSLPASRLSLARAEAYVGALQLPAEQARTRRPPTSP